MKSVALIVLDGWGIGENNKGNPLTYANLPTFKEVEKKYSSTLLNASGIAVGLLWGEPGNSEAGHITMGAGKIFYQYLPRIIISIRNGSFFKNPAFLEAASHIKKNDSLLHIMGLVSSGAVHAYADHLYALLELAKKNNIENRTVLHIFTDGRDAPPKEGVKFVADLKKRLEKEKVGRIGTIIGRRFPMDRNLNWSRTERAYKLLVEGEGEKIKDPAEYLKKSYREGKTDEFIEPAIVVGGLTPGGDQTPLSIKNGDAVIFLNYREDSARQLTKAFVLDEFNEFHRKKLENICFVTMTQYEKYLPVKVAYLPVKIIKPLAKVISDAGLRQLHIAEIDKYAHVTYFFNGLREKAFPGEARILIPSLEAPHNKAPEMKASEITQNIIQTIKSKRYQFVLANFANPDMVAHTGDFNAAVRAAETIDGCLKIIIKIALENNWVLTVTADHGNIEEMLDLITGEARTEHTTNPVPFYLIGRGFERKSLYTTEKTVEGILSDVAPTILELLDLEKPEEMTGQSLIGVLKT